jgi:aspartyl-tRNA(Asn)/glutamyl-tRNA(Gln) amidotransferase subunit B
MTEFNYESYEPVIGLEIHAQLNTRTKVFSRAPNRFGDEPNTNIGIVDTGQPGSLPVLNREVVKKAVMFGLAVGATIAKRSTFDRKSYFYPDSPRNYQITQFENPIIKGGSIQADVLGQTKIFEINHAHIEDDAGMLKHFTQFAGVDYNRAGSPLIEIVSKPCMFSPKDASAYAMAIRSILLYLDVSDCNMEEGSLRIDVNVSVRKKGETDLRPKCEIKNMNSFDNMEKAIEFEIRRQVQIYETHPNQDPKGLVKSATYRFDPERKENILMRTKERAEDYRYFPEPDLPPLVLTDAFIDSIRSNLPELPHQRFKRYIEVLGLTEYAASVLINDKTLCDIYEKALNDVKNPKALCNWITVEFAGRIKESGKSLIEFGINPQHVCLLVNMIEEGTITGKIAKTIADLMIEAPGKSPKEILDERPDLQPMKDSSSIEKIVNEVLQSNPDSIRDYLAGKDRAFQYLVGQVMKQTKGTASPEMVRDLLIKKIHQ